MPDFSLVKYIDSYCVVEGYPGPKNTDSYAKMFPLGYPMIEFNLSDKWIKTPVGIIKTDRISSNITSFTNMPFSLQPLGRIRTAVARLHPLSLRKILGDDVQTNTVFDPRLVFKQSFKETEEKLAMAKNWQEMKIYLDEFFTGVFEGSRIKVDKRVRQMMRKIITKGGILNLKDATKEIGISQKRIEQLFYTHVGMTPKEYAGIARFQKVLAAYNPKQSLTELSQAAGYYDQSHFIRHFKSITNTTPKEFFKNE